MNNHIIVLSKSAYQEHLANTPHHTTYLETAAGILEIFFTEKGIFRAQFAKTAPTHAKKITPPSTLLITGTAFQCAVWQAASSIPVGSVATYQELAQRIGKDKAWRAVARALAANTIAYKIPCHRVVPKTGAPGGYRWGSERKALLLQEEAP